MPRGSRMRSGDLLTDIAVSARRVFLGFALAALVAVPLGIVMGVWRPAKAVMDPFVSLLRPLPSITWIPLTILWLGIGEAQKIAIVFMGSWIYILLYTVREHAPGRSAAAAGGAQPRRVGSGGDARGDPAGRAAGHHRRAEGDAGDLLVLRADRGDDRGAERVSAR